MVALRYLEEWNDKRTQGEVGGFLQLGVKLFYRQVRILQIDEHRTLKSTFLSWCMEKE